VVTIARPSVWIWCAALAIAGSVLGSAIFYEIVSRASERFLRKYTGSRRGARFKQWFDRYGLATVFVCALVPFPFMPLKVMAVSACAIRCQRWRFIGVILAARIPRYGGVAFLGSRLGQDASGWLGSHVWHMGILALVLLIALYWLLRLSDRSRLAPALGSPEGSPPCNPR
jgi:uncharacterized membrane protein YdjX (TVP38/TMEM64 family)